MTGMSVTIVLHHDHEVSLFASLPERRARHQPHGSCKDPRGHLQVVGRLSQKPELSEGRSLSSRCLSASSSPFHLYFHTTSHSERASHQHHQGRLSRGSRSERDCGSAGAVESIAVYGFRREADNYARAASLLPLQAGLELKLPSWPTDK